MFNAYLMIDWSANNRPKKGKNSIWYYPLQKDDQPSVPRNPETRQVAFEEIRCILLKNSARCIRTLVGFDFAYGYPKGFAAALRLQGEPWRDVWQEIFSGIEDNKNNSNNRFKFASDLNYKISHGTFPFWGCHKGEETSTLRCTQPQNGYGDLEKYRITEQRLPGPQPVWKLFYAGSVGSQTLVGIPYLKRLRYDRQLASVSCVWPFETGLCRPPKNALIVFAEIYPSLINNAMVPLDGEVRDATQVRCLANYFADKDSKGNLAPFFEGPSDLTNEQRLQIEKEEGWILGVLK